MSSQIQPTLLDKLGLIPVVLRTILAAFTRLVTHPFHKSRANSLLKDVAWAAFRTNLSFTSTAQEQWLFTLTEKVYLAGSKWHKFTPDIEVIERAGNADDNKAGKDGLKLFWLGSRKAEKVVLYFHGGGYVLCSTPGHIAWLNELQKLLAQDHDVSIAVLGYTLAPHGQYPVQLREAVETVDYFVNTLHKKPSDIIIAGDSAGANLALGLFSHLLHPHPAVEKIDIPEPFAGVVLISPWTKFKADVDSATRNAGTDLVPTTVGDRWSALFLGNAKGDPYNQAGLAPDTWFAGLDGKVKEVFIWAGGGELLVDSIDILSKALKGVHPRVEYVVEPGAAHEEFILEKMIGITAKAQGTENVEKWVKARL